MPCHFSAWEHSVRGSPSHHSSSSMPLACPSSGSTTSMGRMARPGDFPTIPWRWLHRASQEIAAATTWKADVQFIITCSPSEAHFQVRVLAQDGPCYPTPTGGSRPHGSAAGGLGRGTGQPCDQPARRGITVRGPDGGSRQFACGSPDVCFGGGSCRVRDGNWHQ